MIDKIGNQLVKCSMKCEGISNKPKKGIIPRGLVKEERRHGKKCIIVGLNPGKCKPKEKYYYLHHGIKYKSIHNYYYESKLNIKPYFKNAREMVTDLGFKGDILWTDLVKCECSGRNGVLPIQTSRICINKYLKREINHFNSSVIFTLGNAAFNYCSISFPDHFVIGIPHTSGSYGDFYRLRRKINANLNFYKNKIKNNKDKNGYIRAIQLSKIKIKRKRKNNRKRM